MQFHHGLALAAVIGTPILVGAIVVFNGDHRKSSAGRIAITAITAMALSLLVVIPVANTCANSRDIALVAPLLLTPEELKTLRSKEPICPTVFQFTRDGNETCLVSDHDGGASVGCG